MIELKEFYVFSLVTKNVKSRSKKAFFFKRAKFKIWISKNKYNYIFQKNIN